MLRPVIAAAAITLVASPAATTALAQEVNVYTTRQPELIEPIFEAFTAETGIEVNTLFAGSGLIERMKAEGDRSPADLFVTADISNLKAAADAGLTQPHGSEVVNEVVPAALRDGDGRWFALTTRARVVYASKERVEEGAIQTYEGLADDKWADSICIRPGVHPYNLALISAMIIHHGEEDTKAWLEGLKDNLARKPQGNDRAQVKAVWAGECDLAVGNTYYMGKMLEDPEQQQWAEAVNVVFPEFEDGGTHVNISGAALTKSAPNREAAVQLIEYMLSEDAQEMYAELNYEYPVREGVPLSDVVKAWGTFEPDSVSLAKIGDLRDEALRLVEEVGFDN